MVSGVAWTAAGVCEAPPDEAGEETNGDVQQHRGPRVAQLPGTPASQRLSIEARRILLSW